MAQLSVDKQTFWKDRVYEALATGAELYTTVYNVHSSVWQNIQNSHQGVLKRFITPAMKVLDAGCGYGALYDVMPKVADYVGVDFSPELLEIAKHRHPNLNFRLADARSLPDISADYFDIAICRSVDGMLKEHIGLSAWETIEAELCRVSKRLLLLSYEEPCNYFLPSPRVSGSVVVAGIPRTGSTMLWRALAGLPPGDYTPPGLFGMGSPINVKKLLSFTNELPTDSKVIFIFGDVLHSVISTKLNRYTPQHFEHCGYTGSPEPDIFGSDSLGYEGVFEDWVTNNRYHTLCVRYETLFDNLEAISEFLGRQPITLPLYKLRATNRWSVEPKDIDTIEAAYGPLIEAVKHMPDVLELNPPNGARVT